MQELFPGMILFVLIRLPPPPPSGAAIEFWGLSGQVRDCEEIAKFNTRDI